jgi:DASH complex subunit DAD2
VPSTWLLVCAPLTSISLLLVLRIAHKEVAKFPKPKTDQEGTPEKMALPQTLVRIPTEHAPALQAQAQEAEGSTQDEE